MNSSREPCIPTLPGIQPGVFIFWKLKTILEDIAANAYEQMIQYIVADIRKRCHACQMADKDHLEVFLEKL